MSRWGDERWVLPLVILVAGVVMVAILVMSQGGPPQAPPESVAPLVRVETVTEQPHRFVVEAHGTVVPRTESTLVAQVEGEAVWVAPSFVSGGFFSEGDLLVRIEPVDYEADLERARAVLARARSELSRAEKDLERQRRLANRSVASEARIDDAENAFAVARANAREAAAELEQAERDLERTEIRAPYDGRVRAKQVDVGQFVNRGSSLATIYAVDYAEVRLPVPDRELSYLDLPLGFRSGVLDPRAAGTEGEPQGGETDGEGAAEGPKVRLYADFAGRTHTWHGYVVRTEGEIDPRSRTVNVVARVEDPYGRRADEPVVPLAVGLFVRAEILGREVDDAVVLPRVALQGEARVLVIDEDERLHFRDVEVLRLERENVVIGDGLAAGERVCVSPLPSAVDGMAVRVAGQAPGLAERPPGDQGERS